MKEFFKLPKTRTLLLALCAILAVLIAFGVGILIGYRRGLFASRFGEDYYHNFYGGAGDAAFMMPMPPPFNTHGVVGSVIDISSGTIAVQDPHGNEESVAISSDTPIREMGQSINFTAIQIGDHVTIIGEPNDDGQVEARFIRVFTEPSTTP